MKKMLYPVRRTLVGAFLFFGLGLSLSASEVSVRDTSMYIFKTDGTIATYAVSDVDRVAFNVHKDTPAQSVSASAHAVDLGLSVKWSDMNVGAEFAEQSGCYFSWGDTAEKVLYTKPSYDHYTGGNYTELGTQISGTDYDAATALWGDKWRMPTKKEFQELVDDCTWYWITQNGVSGYEVFGPNGNSIFLPQTGYMEEASKSYTSYGEYWTGSRYSYLKAYSFSLSSSSKGLSTSAARYEGLALRPVYGDAPETPAEPETGAYVAVDLGLSVKWCDMNVGALSPEQYGGYFAWGETEEKDEYTSSNCTTYGKNIGSDIGGTDYDVAHVKMGGDWRMPTKDECKELIDDCTWAWTLQHGIHGYKVTGPNGNSIFLPAAGYRYGSSLNDAGSDPYGRYCSSSANEYDMRFVHFLGFDFSRHETGMGDRYYGRSVRAVCP